MAKLGTTIRPHDHDTEQSDFELLPDGNYKLEVSAGDVKQDDDRNTTLNLAIDVIEPEEFAKRKFFMWIDIEHNDAQKQERGQKEIAKLSRAMFGADAPSEIEDSDELLFHSFTARVKKGEAGVSKAGRAYKARNSISKYYYPDEGNVPDPEIFAEPNKPANDNRPASRAPTNDNRAAAPAKATGTAGKARPWGKG